MTRELRIYGPPGTGKTTHLKGRVEATVRARGPHGIRIASLTRAAAAEIGSRVDLPKEACTTLHAHAFHALGRPELAETPEGIERWNKRAHKLGEAFVIPERRKPNLDDVAGEAMVPGTEGEALLQTYSMLRARATPRELWPPKVVAFAEHWEAHKAGGKLLDFNDLIERAIAEVPYMPGGPSVLLLDEAQDMSRLDMQLARQWGEACEVFVVVGDPDQNLYQWRGADPGAFTAVELDDDRVSVLAQSYRVPEAVHAYAVQWLVDTLPTRSNAAYHPRLDDAGAPAPGKVRRAEHVFREPESLVNELEEQLTAGRRAMVLASANFMLDPITAVMRRRGVPFGNPYRVTDGRLNPLAGAGRLLAYLAAFDERKGGEDRDWTWDEVRRWSEPLKAQGVFERGAKSFIEAKCVKAGRFDDDDPKDRPAPFDQVMELLTDEARIHLGLCDLDWYEQHLLASKASSLAYSLNVARNRGPDALKTQPRADGGAGVIVGTIHSVKGGEAEVVYVFPDLSRAGFEGWLLGGPRHDAVARQMYVAFTRARDELVLCEPSGAYAVQFPPAEVVG